MSTQPSWEELAELEPRLLDLQRATSLTDYTHRFKGELFPLIGFGRPYTSDLSEEENLLLRSAEAHYAVIERLGW